MIGYIPARGGSKRLPRKNIRLLNGKPIIAYPIEALLHTEGVDEVFVSSDDPEIGAVAQEYGAQWLGPRSPDLSDDKAGFIDLIHRDVPKHCKHANDANTVLFVLATAALLTPETLSKAIAAWEEGQPDILMSVLEIGKNCYWSLIPQEDGTLKPMFPDMVRINSQDLPKAYNDAGQFYIFQPDTMQKFGSHKDVDRLQPFEIRPSEAVDIDTEDDWAFLELRLKEKSR